MPSVFCVAWAAAPAGDGGCVRHHFVNGGGRYCLPLRPQGSNICCGCARLAHPFSAHRPLPSCMILSRLLDRFGTVMTGIIVVAASIVASVSATAVMMVLWFGGMNATAMALSVLVPAVCAPLFVTLELRLVVQLRAAREEMRRLSIVDPLSGAYNRRHLVALVEQQVQRALRYGEPLGGDAGRRPLQAGERPAWAHGRRLRDPRGGGVLPKCAA